MNLIQELEQEEMARIGKTIPPFGAGDTLAVRTYVVEGQNRRIQSFEGVVIAKKNRGLNSSFTVRRTASGSGVERTFQTHSPLIENINVVRHGDVRRAKLYYLRKRQGRSARIAEKLGSKKGIKAT
jgi:large subunit ribosomal protein L19